MAEVLFEKRGASGVVTLNRPSALNALTLGMVRAMDAALRDWARDDSVAHIVIEGAGEKGFCAGGDIRALHDWGRANAPEATGFYREEYRLNRLIKTYPKPYIALMDGITMGGGVGVSVHGTHRVASARSVFAMPETGIGLLPDVGGTYFLPRLRGQIGAYLVLTGARLKAGDMLYAGVATHYVPSAQLPALKTALEAGGDSDAILAAHNAPAPDAPLATRQGDIDAHFKGDNVGAILAGLAEDGSDWALAQAEIIAAKSPTSCAVALRQMRFGADNGFDACMRLEMRAVTRLMARADFYEGVRAVILDKDNTPRWQPSRHSAIDAGEIDAIFADLPPDEELNFDDL